MTAKSKFSMKGTVAYYPALIQELESYDEARTIIGCLGGETTLKSDEATHELALQHTPKKGLPLITQQTLNEHVEGAMGELVATAPAPLTAHLPVFVKQERKQPFLASLLSRRAPGSQYFGSPWMPNDARWPEYDGRPMHFVLQLDLETIPDTTSLPRSGLLTLFKADAYDEHGEDSFVTIYDTTKRGRVRRAPEVISTLPPFLIEDWKPVLDHPDQSDLEDVEPEIPFIDLLEVTASTTRGKVLVVDGPEVSEAKVAREGLPYRYHNFQADKLGGRPNWVQAPDWPVDSEDHDMEFVYQVGDEYGMALGDSDLGESHHPVFGRGQIFYSEATGELRFVWSSL